MVQGIFGEMGQSLKKHIEVCFTEMDSLISLFYFITSIKL